MAVLEKRSSLTGKNQVTIPAEIVEAAGLEEGSELVWIAGERPGEVTVKVAPQVSREEALRELEQLIQKYKGQINADQAIEELSRTRMEEDIERERDLRGL